MAWTYCHVCDDHIDAANFRLHQTRSRKHRAIVQRARESARGPDSQRNDPEWYDLEDNVGDAPPPAQQHAEELEDGPGTHIDTAGEAMGGGAPEDIGGGTMDIDGDGDIPDLLDDPANERRHVVFPDAGKLHPLSYITES
jgi:hypothetical protein